MGCLTGLAALLALAIPLAIARHTLAGALVLIVVFAALAVAMAHRRGRRGWIVRIALVALGYGAIVTIVHLAR